MLKIELSNDIAYIEQQIYAMGWKIKHDTNRKDVIMHKQSLKQLNEHKEQLKAGD